MRYHLLDEIRGITLISMILYHGCWDLVYIFQVNAPWYESQGAYYWQQSICWTFIFLSGFCWHLGRDKVRHGLKVFLAGAVITAATLLFMPEDRVVFGVLTFIGSAALLVTLGDWFVRGRGSRESKEGEEKEKDRERRRLTAPLGFFICICLFALTKQVNSGYLGFASIQLLKLPESLYQNNFTAFFGFPGPDFYSTDYFSLIPWIFLYIAGVFLYPWMEEKGRLGMLEKGYCPPLRVIGRHSLIIYMVHQPVLYGLCSVLAGAYGGCPAG